MSKKRTKIGAFVRTTWTNLNVRCRNSLYRYLAGNKSKTYADVSIFITRDEFKKWVLENQQQIEAIEAMARPSIDRKDKNRDYTLDNIQAMELGDNVRKDKVKSSDWFCRCSRCGETKAEHFFARDKRRQNGHSTLCRECDNARRAVVTEPSIQEAIWAENQQKAASDWQNDHDPFFGGIHGGLNSGTDS